MSEHLRPDKILPQILMKELLRLARKDRNWIAMRTLDDSTYEIQTKHDTWLERYTTEAMQGHNWLGLHSASIWLLDGPKVFKPSQIQQDALAEVAVNIRPTEFEMPFPAILIDTNVPPFQSVLVCQYGSMIVLSLYSVGNKNDIVTTIYRHPSSTTGLIEESIVKYDADCQTTSDQAHKAGRIAINACLALTHYGSASQMLFPIEAQRDKHFAKEESERGHRARERVKLAPVLLTFKQEIQLHNTRDDTTHGGTGTGGEKSTHWRRGHWHRVAHGVGKTERKLVFYKPMLIRADKFGGDLSKTSTTYKG